ncbi:MAG TPA: hypothetical protein VF609_12610 [Flavisolibacter sp.]
MKKACLLITIVINLLSCQKNEADKNTCAPEQHTFRFQTGKNLDTVRRENFIGLGVRSFYTIKGGTNEVFVYTRTNKDCPDYIDDEGSRDIVFQVPEGINSFAATDSITLAQMKVGMQINCSECNTGLLPIFHGSIEGRRINAGTWRIKASLLPAQNSNLVEFDTNFMQR